MEHCVLDKFNDKYTDVIDVNAETHSDCRYKLGSTQDLLLQRRTTAQEVVVVTCQPTVNTVIKQSIEIDSQTEALDLSGKIDAALVAAREAAPDEVMPAVPTSVA